MKPLVLLRLLEETRVKCLCESCAEENREDTVGGLHAASATPKVQVVGILVKSSVSPPGQLLDLGKLSMRLQVMFANDDFVFELFITFLPLGKQVLVCIYIKVF